MSASISRASNCRSTGANRVAEAAQTGLESPQAEGVRIRPAFAALLQKVVNSGLTQGAAEEIRRSKHEGSTFHAHATSYFHTHEDPGEQGGQGRQAAAELAGAHPTVEPSTLKAFFTRNGGEKVGGEALGQ